ncbi:MAG: acetyl-CoA carboxylase biotin carboxyl carrier protein [Candidatus Omnitrophica bacterium]|nr:acetyl-CoA carboxylase biotin carboxyl carrier protein [Candidatus Omnitrophota bacterium]
MNLKEIKEVIALMNENNLTEIEIERDGTKIKLRKGFSPVVEGQASNIITQAASQPSAEAKPEAKGPDRSNAKEIKAPMVGTFYRAPSPEVPPYIEPGQTVEVGQVVCIIEAMKLMNEIKSEIRGKVVEIPVDNAQPVEFGQTIFVIEPV